MTPTMSPTARFLDEAIRNSPLTQAEIAARAGSPNAPSSHRALFVVVSEVGNNGESVNGLITISEDPVGVAPLWSCGLKRLSQVLLRGCPDWTC